MARPIPGFLLLFLLLQACGGTSSPSDPGPAPVDTVISVPPRGTATTFDLATWNIQYFGSPGGGPTNDAVQLRRVRDVMTGAEMDLWGVQEISDEDDFADLMAELPGYRGLLANDPSVADGASYYEDFNGTELKVGIVYDPTVVEVLAARVVLTELDFEFAGRPPLELRLRVSLGEASREVVLLVLHAKAGADGVSWERRAAAAKGLRSHLDSTWPDVPVFVVGDWNDDIDTSIVPGRESPYEPLVSSAPLWVFPTSSLTAAGQTSIIGYDDVIDHILASDEGMAWYEEDSAVVYRVDDIIPRYEATTSDHLPVLARFRWPG